MVHTGLGHCLKLYVDVQRIWKTHQLGSEFGKLDRTFGKQIRKTLGKSFSGESAGEPRRTGAGGITRGPVPEETSGERNMSGPSKTPSKNTSKQAQFEKNKYRRVR